MSKAPTILLASKIKVTVLSLGGTVSFSKTQKFLMLPQANQH